MILAIFLLWILHFSKSWVKLHLFKVLFIILLILLLVPLLLLLLCYYHCLFNCIVYVNITFCSRFYFKQYFYVMYWSLVNFQNAFFLQLLDFHSTVKLWYKLRLLVILYIYTCHSFKLWDNTHKHFHNSVTKHSSWAFNPKTGRWTSMAPYLSVNIQFIILL